MEKNTRWLSQADICKCYVTILHCGIYFLLYNEFLIAFTYQAYAVVSQVDVLCLIGSCKPILWRFEKFETAILAPAIDSWWLPQIKTTPAGQVRF